MRFRTFAFAAAHWAVCVASNAAAAQAPVPACRVQGSHAWLATRPSPLDSATLAVDGKIAKICYSRPSLRGRAMDSLLPLNLAWRTGANEPATLTLTGALEVGGVALAAGQYVILTVPRTREWLLVFNTTPDTVPAQMFKTLTDVGHGTGQVEHLDEPIEQFTIRAVTDSAPAFILEWGNRRVRVPVRSAH